MKKIFISTLILSSLVFTYSNKNINKIDNNVILNNKEALVTSSVTYENFNSIPSSWELYNQCDTNNTKTSINEDYLVISHDKTKGVGNDKYYGSVYNLNVGNTYKDFTFTMTFKMTDWADGARWIGIVYHSKMVGNNLTGYLMNYRTQNGQSAYSYIDKNKGFHDTASSGNIALTDRNLHTLKIKMKGSIATHYMDGKEIVSWDTSEANSTLGSLYDEGGFSLIVNRSTLNIKKINIIPSAEDTTIDSDETLVDTYQVDTNIVNGPTNIARINNINDLNNIANSNKLPSNAILNFNKDKNIIDKDGNFIDSASNVIDKYLKHKVIPIFKVEDIESKDALIDFLNNDRKLVDVSALSSKASFIKEIREKYPYSRGILEINELNSSIKDLYFESNINNCPTILLSEKLSTYENINYLHSRMKTVWTNLDSTNEDTIHNVIFSGTYGIVSDDFNKVYNKLESYKSDDNETILTRSPYNIAHRGLPKSYNENSISGVKAAISNGATHLELDVYLTKDRHLMVSHDNDLSRTTNAPKNTLIEGSTFDEVRQYDLDLFTPFEKVPDLYEIFDILKEDKKGTILVCELKTQNSDAITVIKNALTNDYPTLKDRLVFISFYRNQCKEAHLRASEIPCADLNTLNSGNFIENLERMGKYGNVIDTPNGNKLLNEKYLRDRGIVGWYWTMDNETSIDDAINNGFTGMTNNKADYFGTKIQYISLDEFNELPDFKVNDEIDINLVKYNGEITKSKGNIETICINDGKTYLSIKYKADGIIRYSYLIEAKLKEKEEKPVVNDNKNKGCSGSIVTTSIVLSSVSLIGLLVLLLNKKVRNLNK